MGLLDVFRRRKEPDEPERISLNVGETESFYRSKYAENLSSTKDFCKKTRSEIIAKINSLSLEPLEKAKFEPGDSTYAAVNMAKQAYITKFKTLISTELPQGDSYEDLMKFQQECGSFVKSLKGASPKQVIIMSNYFREELSELQKNVKSVESLLKEYSEKLTGSRMGLMNSISSMVKDIQNLVSSRDSLVKKKESLLEKRSSLELQVKDSRQKLDSLLASQKWANMENEEAEAESLGRDAETLKFRIGAELSSLKRPLKKTKHVIGPEMGIDNFISDPFSSFLEDSGQEKLENILKTTIKLFSEDKISLKSSEKDKLTDLNDRLPEVVELGKQYLTASSKRDSKIKSVDNSELPVLKRNLESDIEGLENKLSEAKSQVKSAEDSIRETGDEIQRKKEELENLLNQTGDIVSISI